MGPQTNQSTSEPKTVQDPRSRDAAELCSQVLARSHVRTWITSQNVLISLANALGSNIRETKKSGGKKALIGATQVTCAGLVDLAAILVLSQSSEIRDLSPVAGLEIRGVYNRRLLDVASGFRFMSESLSWVGRYGNLSWMSRVYRKICGSAQKGSLWLGMR